MVVTQLLGSRKFGVWQATAVAVLVLAVFVAAPNIRLNRAAAILGDINSDGKVDVIDLSTLLAQYGKAGSADLNNSGTVDITDLSILLNNYGKTAAVSSYAGEYWNVAAFTDTTPPSVPSGTPTATRTDAAIDFDWPGSPLGGINSDYFVARWTANRSFDAGSYTFTATTDDGMRVYVDGQVIIDQWKRQAATTYTAQRTMTSGVHSVKVEYYDQMGGGTAKFSYAKDGTSSSPSPSNSPTPNPGGGPQAMIRLAAGNPFTTQLPDNAPLMGASDQTARRNEWRYWINTLPGGIGIEQSQYAATLYQVFLNGDIKDSEGDFLCKGTFAPSTSSINSAGIQGRGWPTGSCLKPASGGEGHMALYSPETGAYGEFYQPTITNRINSGWGGYIPNTFTSLGMATQPNPWWGSQSLGLHTGSIVITEKEIRAAEAAYNRGDHANAYIPHILGYEGFRHTPATWEYPATKTDAMGFMVQSWGVLVPGQPGWSPHGRGFGPLPMGGIVRINAGVDVTQLTGDGTPRGKMVAQIIARTLQKYGATMSDYTGGGLYFLAEEAPHQARFSYGHNGIHEVPAVRQMITQALDRGWISWVNTGRNLEVDTGGSAPAGAYRPPR